MAELEAIYYNHTRVDLQAVVKLYNRLDSCVFSMVTALLKMHPSRNTALGTYYKKFNAYVRFMLEPEKFDTNPPFTMEIEEISLDTLNLAGTKAFNLARVKQELGLPVPQGFVVTTNAFHLFMEQNRLNSAINEILAGLNIHCSNHLEQSAQKITSMIMDASLPQEIITAMDKEIGKLRSSQGSTLTMAVRSSALGEDTTASFAGQYLTLLGVNKDEIAHAYKRVIAGKYSAQALFYRVSKGLLDHATPMAVLVLEMIDATASGIIYTRGINAPHGDDLMIHWVKGLGEPLVGGQESPRTIIVRNRNAPAAATLCHERKRMEDLLDPAGIATLVQWGASLENFFKSPQDIEWTMDTARKLFILQSRPLNFDPETKGSHPSGTAETIPNPVLLQGGETAASGTAAGTVFLVTQPSDLANLPKGAIVISRSASPGLVLTLDRASAIVTDIGSCSGHLATVAREFNIPALVNTKNATTTLIHGDRVTVDADNQIIYQGEIKNSPPALRSVNQEFKDTPFMEIMEFIMEFISPLGLMDPTSSAFCPEGCRSIHDIIRFAHETAIQEMFSLGTRKGGRKKGARRLVSDLPMLFYLLDVGDGIVEIPGSSNQVTMEEITSTPLKALLKGLSHPDIYWSDFTHFDWENHDRIIMAGGIISTEAPQFGSYAVFSNDYLNVNLRFGYHFVVLDTLCTHDQTENYILFRFSGGGGDARGRALRAGFTGGVLKKLGFGVDICGDLVDGRFHMGEQSQLTLTLEMIGRLLGATRLMDIYLTEDLQVDHLVNEFMNGRYDFSSSRC